MTIEKKIQDILGQILMAHHHDISSQDDYAIAEATQAILELIKPISRKAIRKILYNNATNDVGESHETIWFEDDIKRAISAILAEWEKE